MPRLLSPILAIQAVIAIVIAASVSVAVKVMQTPTSTQFAVKGANVAPTTSTWVQADGLRVIFDVPVGVKARVEVWIHGHGAAHDGGRRLDVAAFDNDQPCGIGCSSDSTALLAGMGLSHTPSWLPVSAVSVFDAQPGAHIVTARVRNAANNGPVNFHSGAMIVTVTVMGRQDWPFSWFESYGNGIRLLQEAPIAV